VAHVGPVTPGGMGVVLQALVGSRLAERYRQQIIPTYRTAEPRGRLMSFLAGLACLAIWCLRPGGRIVHVHTAVRGSLYRKSLCVALAKLLRRPVVLHVHAGEGDIRDFAERVGPFRRALFRRAFLTADRVLSVSWAGAREIERRFGMLGVQVVPNAAPEVDAETLASRATDGGGADAELLYLGGFEDPAKGGAVLVEAVRMLVDAAAPVRITVAGPGEPPGALRELEGDRVRWVGYLDSWGKEAAFRQCDVFVLPSLSEGLPMALLEAMAYGRAIVGTRAGGVPEAVEDGREAVLVEPGDAAALCTAVVELARDPKRRARLGAAGRERARRLTDDEVTGRLDAIYRELVAA
jgi:glycosyltransferase involved in cell wall biosynthesis